MRRGLPTITHNGFIYVRESELARVRAEVLAACIAKLERDARNCFAAADKAGNEGRGGTYESWRRTAAQYQNIANDFRQLQPAASALEELLRKAELKTLQWAAIEDCPHTPLSVINRIIELEKARASEGEESTGS